MAVNRSLLAKALGKTSPSNYLSADSSQRDLLGGQDISQFAMNSSNFGSGQARGVGLAAQLATAGVGAYTQYKAQKDLKEQELSSQQQFAQQFPHLADIASTLSPETRQAYTMEALKQGLAANDPIKQLELQGKQLDIQKTQAEISKLRKETAMAGQPDPEKTFKNATALRQDYLTNSKTFQGAKDGYERVIASAENPSAAGDLSLIFGYMKTLDPNSTVREGEFATAESARGLPSSLVAKYNKVVSGERLTADQRNDFVDRATKLYNQAEKSQNKIADQYTKIAKRNQINPEDVVVDFSTSVAPKAATPQFSKQEALAELERRKKAGLIK